VNGASLQLTNFCKELLLASTKNIPMLDLPSKNSLQATQKMENKKLQATSQQKPLRFIT
jgi:hypothetical protein